VGGCLFKDTPFFKIEIMENRTLGELIKENKSIKNLWEEYLTLYNYVDNKMVEGCVQAEELIKELNK